ncbi:unnamed protein product [Aspergillus oryzae]|nr:unnamed protein product [Aspergillus oryzae]GMF90087.1 unnamed protein product [Aspergillus oryzae]
MPSRQSCIPNLDLSPSTLQISAKTTSPHTPGASSDGPSPLTPRSPKSSSSSTFFKGTTIRSVTQESNSKANSQILPVSPGLTAESPTQGVTAIPQYPPSPRDSPKHSRDPSRSFFANLKAPKVSHRAQRSDSSGNSGDKPRSRGSSRDRRTQISSKLYESTPDLPGAIERAAQQENKSAKREAQTPPKAAEVKPTGNPHVRSHTIDRLTDVNSGSIRKDRYGGSMVPSASLSQVSGASAALFNNIKQSSSGAADRIGKAGKGFFGKITRSGSTNERELINDDNYVCSVINLPLIEQARRTRIAKRLEDCKDKTEFWMPALPYRCIE